MGLSRLSPKFDTVMIGFFGPIGSNQAFGRNATFMAWLDFLSSPAWTASR
jgi:hypothetical protein